MSTDYFTSDTHFNQPRTLEFSRRPFKDVEEMNKCMLDNINSLPLNATLYHAGDFGDYEFIKQIRSDIKVILICGNYEIRDMFKKGMFFDDFKEFLKSLGFYDVFIEDLIITPFEGDEQIRIIHEPSKRFKTSLFTLFGHVHRLQMVKRNSLNVGVDCHCYKPVSLDDLAFFKNAIQNHYDDEVFN